ncbi:MAG TPA: hypothetical protein ENN73_01340 [Firmicutes bacterium]|nr:hypothetical protein [Bacillota bacterium]
MRKTIFLIIVLISSLLFVSADNIQAGDTHKKMGDQYLMQKMYEEAAEEFKIAVQFNPVLESELRPKIARAYSLQGIEKSKNKHWKEAETAFKRSLEYNVNQPTVHYNLGVVLENLGKNSEAIEVYKNFLNFTNADPNLVKSVKDRLTVLEKPRPDPTTEVQDHYVRGLELMTDNKLAEAKAEFLLVKGTNEKEAKEMIKIINGLEKLDSNTSELNPGQEEASAKNTIISLGIAFQRKDINAIKAIYSKHASNSTGGYEEIINYYNDFWFTFFDNLTFTITNITVVTESTTAVVDCYVTIQGKYSGPDMSAVNPKFKPGNEYKSEYSRQFLMVKERSLWYITN